MGIIWTIFLVFVAVMVIQIFDIKENVRHEKKEKKSEDKKEVKKDGGARTDLDYYSLFKGIAVLVIIGVLIYEALK